MDNMTSARTMSTARSMSVGVRDRVMDLVNRLVQRAFLQYLALFVVAALGFWLFLHYGTTWFDDVTTGQKRIWAQAGLSIALALGVCAVAYFTRLL